MIDFFWSSLFVYRSADPTKLLDICSSTCKGRRAMPSLVAVAWVVAVPAHPSAYPVTPHLNTCKGTSDRRSTPIAAFQQIKTCAWLATSSQFRAPDIILYIETMHPSTFSAMFPGAAGVRHSPVRALINRIPCQELTFFRQTVSVHRPSSIVHPSIYPPFSCRANCSCCLFPDKIVIFPR